MTDPRPFSWLPVVLAGLLLAGATFAQAPPDSARTSPPDTLLAPASSVRQVAPDTLNPAPLTPAEEEVEVGGRVDTTGFQLSKNPTTAAIRSIILPGWGQAYTDRWLWAAGFFGAYSGLVYGAVVQHNRYEDALESKGNVKSEQQRKLFEQSANFYRDDRNRLIWYVAGVILLSSVDAYVSAHLYDFQIDPNLGSTPAGDGVQAGVTVTFSL